MKFFIIVALLCACYAFNYNNIDAAKAGNKSNGSIIDDKKNIESLFAATTRRRRPAVQRGAIRTRRSDLLADKNNSYNKRIGNNRKVQADESKGIGEIVHGRDAKIAEAPFVVKLYLGRRGVCTGSLIADNLILTAEHCYPNKSEFQRKGGKAVNRLGEEREIRTIEFTIS